VRKRGSVLLAGNAGRVLNDGYAAYHVMHTAALRECGKSFTHAHCWPDARQDLIELETTFPAEVKEALQRIGAAFAREREISKHRTDDPIAIVCKNASALVRNRAAGTIDTG
jgi:Transposase IS66 family